jgi:hypothetical protein
METKMSRQMKRWQPVAPAAIRAHISMAFLIVAWLFGGAGASYPLIRFGIVLMAIAAAWEVATNQARAGLGMQARRILWILAALAGLMVLQLVPLPPAIWRALPGHEAAVAVLAATGSSGWHPLNLAPDTGISALLALITPASAFYLTARMGNRERVRAVRAFLAIAGLSALVGIGQFASGADSSLYSWASGHIGVGIGLFVDRNHQAAFLLIAMICAQIPGMIPFPGERSGRGGANWQAGLPALTASGVFALGVIATTSRTGLTLLPFATIGGAAVAAGKRRWAAHLTAFIALLMIAGLALHSDAGITTFARFATVAEDDRALFWANTWVAIRQSLPLGSGFGSFGAYYMTVEPIDQIRPAWVNHAHNDYLEWMLEGGVPAIMVALALLLALLLAARAAWVCGRGRGTILATLLGLAILAAFSIVEYPLRMTGIAVLAGVLAGLLVPYAAGPADRNRIAGGQGRRRWAAPAAMLICAMAMSNYGAESLLRAGRDVAATILAPWSSAAWRTRAINEQVAGQPGAAADAQRALNIAPLDASAARVLALARLDEGDYPGGAALMNATSRLGWRDPVTQLWLANAAIVAGRDDIAVNHIDALLRQQLLAPQMLLQLRKLMARPSGVAAIVGALADRPGWRQGFFNAMVDDAVSRPEPILTLISGLSKTLAPVRPEETELIRWGLADRGKYPEAFAIWRASGGQGYLADGEFTATSGPVRGFGPPFAWRSRAVPGTSSIERQDAGGHNQGSIIISSGGLIESEAVAQTIAPPPGRYRLRVDLVPKDASPFPMPIWRFTCLQADVHSQPAEMEIHWSRTPARHLWGTGEFDVASECAGSELTMAVAANRGRAYSFSLTHIKVDKLMELRPPDP